MALFKAPPAPQNQQYVAFLQVQVPSPTKKELKQLATNELALDAELRADEEILVFAPESNGLVVITDQRSVYFAYGRACEQYPHTEVAHTKILRLDDRVWVDIVSREAAYGYAEDDYRRRAHIIKCDVRDLCVANAICSAIDQCLQPAA